MIVGVRPGGVALGDGDLRVRKSYTAVRTGQVSNVYVIETVGMPVHRIREDRILDEAHASSGDVRRLCDLFGLSIKGAERYTATLDHPGLAGDQGQ